MNRKSKASILGFAAGMLLLALVANNGSLFQAGARGKPMIAVTVAPQAEFVRAVAGELVNIVTMMPPGAYHETYSPPPQDMERLSAAALYLAMGLPPERTGLLPKLAEINRTMKIIDIQNEVAKVYPPRFFAPGDQDPHIWLSPKRAVVMVRITARELMSLDPGNRAAYEANATRLIEQIEAADREIQAKFQGFSLRTIIVYHPAFGYFADDYRLEMVALEEEGKEADPRRLREIIDMAREKGIKVIFYQEDIDGRQSRTFAEELGGQAEKVSPMATDYVENLKRIATSFAIGLK
jgi:zinc transport system substrate-binding protein